MPVGLVYSGQYNDTTLQSHDICGAIFLFGLHLMIMAVSTGVQLAYA